MTTRILLEPGSVLLVEPGIGLQWEFEVTGDGTATVTALAGAAAGWATVFATAAAAIPALGGSGIGVFESGIAPPAKRVVTVPDREARAAHGRTRVVKVRVPMAA